VTLARVEIRAATNADIETTLRLWGETGGSTTVTDTRDGLTQLLAVGADPLLLAERDDSVIGSLIATWDGWRGNFYRLAVHPNQRRQGIALALVREGERRLQARGAIRLTAIVNDDDPAAVAFWTATGYECQSNNARYVRHVGA
jgi:ribosomal protein S18 acetylase RimI-like enzyme